MQLSLHLPGPLRFRALIFAADRSIIVIDSSEIITNATPVDPSFLLQHLGRNCRVRAAFAA